jgi:hypothetical protein
LTTAAPKSSFPRSPDRRADTIESATTEKTETREPALLSTLRQKALPALTEMARWKSRGHALASVMILGRMAGIPEKELTAAAGTGSHAAIIDAALKRLETK